MVEIISALETIAKELESSYIGRLQVRQYTLIPGLYPQMSNILARIVYVEEQKPGKLLGLISRKKTLVSVCETWFFGKETTKRVFVQCIVPLAEESARKHLAEYLN